MLRKHPELFISPQQQYPIYDLNLSFSNYIHECKKLIANARQDLLNDADKIIDANSPFELKPKDQPPKFGVLLVHGLLDSPFTMREISTCFQESGGLVRAVLLPGHGTVPGSLLTVDYHDWIQTVRYGIASLAKEVDKIIIAGYSTGATLALHYALQGETRIDGLIFFAPALKINTTFDFAQNWHRIISWAWPRAKWFTLQEENNYAAYKSCAFNAGYQLYLLIKEVYHLLASKVPQCPVLCVLSEDDVTIASKKTIEYFRQFPNSNNRMILYSNKTSCYQDSRILIRPAAYPAMRIENISHICIAFSPNNRHYGIQGDYCEASHIDENDNVIYTEANRDTLFFDDLLFKLKLSKKQYSRITFNPDFDFMIQSIREFLSVL